MNQIEKPHVSRETLDQLKASLSELGEAWADYGLTIGRSAAETGARTLSATAEVLGDLAETFEEEAERAFDRVERSRQRRD